MSEIDFLNNKPEADEPKPEKRDETKDKIVWTKPEAGPNAGKPDAKASPWSVFSFLKNKSGTPAAVKSADDKNKIRASRREILKMIKGQAAARPAEDKDEPSGKGLFDSLAEKLRNSPSHKEILIDYQQVFNQEKGKRVRPAPLALLKRDDKAAPKPAGIKSPGWLNRLLKFFRSERPFFAKPAFGGEEKIPAPPALKTAPAEVKAVEPKEAAPPAAEVKKTEKKPAEEIPAAVILETSQEAAPDVLETNLITGEIITFFDWRKKIVSLSGAVLISLVTVTAIYFGVSLYQQARLAKNEEQLKKFGELTERIKREEADLKEINDFKTKLALVGQVFDNHVYWTNFFKFLEDNTLKDVYFTGFSGDTGGNYELGALANGYSNISDQVKLMKSNRYITKVEAAAGESAKEGEGSKTKVKFNLKFSLLKSIFLK